MLVLLLSRSSDDGNVRLLELYRQTKNKVIGEMYLSKVVKSWKGLDKNQTKRQL